MQMQPYPISHSIQVKLDWLEFRCLENEFFLFRLSELRSLLENLDEFTTVNIGEEDAGVEAEISRLIQQMSVRKGMLQESYPFIYNEQSDGLELINTDLVNCSIDQHAYLYCLYFSHITKSRIFNNIVRDFSPFRDLLQIIGTVALAGYVKGHSISFGWPRPQGDKYYNALSRVVGLLGEGEVKSLQDVNLFLQTKEKDFKDGGIDVIAWSHPNEFDVVPGGKVIFFVQVASGMNWHTKPVKEDIKDIQKHWLSRPIPRIMDAIVIPFDFDFDDDNLRNAFMEITAHKFGNIFYRLRLPMFLKEGLDLIEREPRLLIERGGDIQKVSQFVIDLTQELQNNAA
ncbi:hypothetical protein ACTZNJ_06895 [Klebsiella pneumoniae]